MSRNTEGQRGEEPFERGIYVNWMLEHFLHPMQGFYLEAGVMVGRVVNWPAAASSDIQQINRNNYMRIIHWFF